MRRAERPFALPLSISTFLLSAAAAAAFFILAAGITMTTPTTAYADAVRREGVAAGLSLVEVGTNSAGQAVYNISADNVDIAEVLKAVYKKMGDPPFMLQENVRGVLNFSLKDATLEEILQGIQTAAVPPIKITPGKTIMISRVSDPRAVASQIQQRMDALRGGRTLSPNFADASLFTTRPVPGEASPLDRPITLNIPDNSPITLLAALQAIEKQTGVPIRLDRSLPQDVKFVATVTRMPLRTMLDNIAPANGLNALKWVAMPDHILIAPADRYQVILGLNVLGSSQVCSRCRQPVAASWSFCPSCGQATPRGKILGSPGVPAGMNRLPGTSIQKLHP